MKDPASQISTEQLAFTSGGKRIRVQMWQAAGTASIGASAPAILVLHGAGVVDSGYRYLSQLARRLTGHGFHTFMVEYFDRTGTTAATDTTIKTHAAVWLETVHDAVDFIAGHPDVDADGIGTLGYSLGGYLAVAHAAQDDRIRAVVELSGGIDAETAAAAHRLPPLLIVHGREDPRVSFNNALELQGLGERLGAPVQTLFLPGERHLLSPGAALVAVRQAMRFFDAHLKGSVVMC